MGYRHNVDDVLDAAVAVAGYDGLGELTFRAISRRLGIADRTVVHYFQTKTTLLEAVLHRATDRLVAVLDPSVGDQPRPGPQLLAASWAALLQPEAAPWLRLYAETMGLAARGTEPYATIAADLARSWTSWFAARLVQVASEDPADVEDRAAALLASLEGLLLLHITSGSELAGRAAQGLGAPPD